MASGAARLVLARHGESEANLLGEFSNRGTKHPLTPLGREQARALAARLDHDGGVERILSSPVLRARQTADVVAEVLGAEIVIDDRLREFDVGRFEGSRAPEHWAEYDEVVAAWAAGDRDRRVGGGESLREIEDRLGSLLVEVAARPGTSLLVGHGGLYLCALPALLDGVSPGWAFAHPLAPTVTVEVHPNAGRLVCARWADLVPPLVE